MQYFKKICSLFLMLCLMIVYVPMSAAAEDNTESGIVKQQLLLGEDLTMRFFAQISEEHRDNGVMTIRVSDRIVRYKVADMTPNEEGYYEFDVDTSAPEMTEKITLSLETEPVNGPLQFSGVWFVSKEDFTKVQLSDGSVVDLGSVIQSDEDTSVYLSATQPASEGGEIGSNSTMVTIGEDPAWGGIVSQATTKAGERVSPVDNQKSIVIDSPINEGYANVNGATYPLFFVNCGWKELDTTTQDVMFYVELPEASSGLRINSLTCNGWSFWVSPEGMEYQYLPSNGEGWINGQISNNDNKDLSLPQGFKGYVRLKIDTARNANEFPESKKLTVQDFSFQGSAFGGDYGSIKLGGVWFVSKEDYTYLKVNDGDAVNMTRDYLVSTMPSAEAGELGGSSSLVSLEQDPAWGGVTSQANMSAASGLTPLGEYESTVIDSPVCEGYFNESYQTYPHMAVNCGWAQLDTATQDVMFYVELPATSSGLRINSFTCNGWSFWVSVKGMEYQYLPNNGESWISGQISNDDNKDMRLPQGFKGYVRLKVDTAKNADEFPESKLQIQNFTFQCDRFGGTPVFTEAYSVRDYAQYILNNNYTFETKNLVKQMLNYGAKAQEYFCYRTHKLANVGYEVESTAVIDSHFPEIAISGAVDGISVYGCTLVVDSKIAVRYYFRAPKGVEGYTFLVRGVEATPVERNGLFYVEETGVTPDRMDTTTTVSVTKDGKELSVEYSPMAYITRMYNKEQTGQSLKKMLLAAVQYFEAAKLYTGVAENAYIDSKIELAPLYGTQDDLLEDNPDRGWRLEAYVNVGDTDNPAADMNRGLDYYEAYHPQLCQVYFYLTAYKDTPVIPQEGIDSIQQVFDSARERGVKILARFAYQSDMEGNGEATDEIMLAHMPQLRPVLENNVDVIHTVEAGFLGAWGEWHSYVLEHDQLALLKGILAMVPESLYVQVRNPGIKNLMSEAEPDNANLQRIGYHDDSFFGWQKALWNDGYNPGDAYWEQMKTESAYVPQGGEMFWGCQYDTNNWSPTSGMEAIRKYSAFHQNSFSLYHSFIEDGLVYWVEPGVGYYSIRDWQTETVRKFWLDWYKVTYDPLWFQNEKGENIDRSAFEFVHDHLGYRLRALNVSLEGILGGNEDLQVSLELQNTGFSVAFNMQSGFAILDENGVVISCVKAGDPSQWLSTDATTGKALTHTVSATLTLPGAPGTYQIAFYLKNSAGTGARLANDLPYMDGYTVLQTIEIR